MYLKVLITFHFIFRASIGFGDVCIPYLLNLAAVEPKTIYLVTPISGSKGLVELAHKVLPKKTKLVVLLPPGISQPANAPTDITYLNLPDHIADISHRESLRRGVDDLMAHLKPENSPHKVIIGAEYGVDWGNSLKMRLGDPSFTGEKIAPHQMVSKTDVRTLLESVPNLLWPKQFKEEDFESKLTEYAAANPKRKLIVKFDKGAGMDGLSSCLAEDVFKVINDHKTGDKYHRGSTIIVEEDINDIPLPPGLMWKEKVFDAVAYTLKDGKTRLKPFSGYHYKKDRETMMYLSDTLFNPYSPEYAHILDAIEASVNLAGYREGGIHFEVHVPVDKETRKVAQHLPFIIGDPNWRFGANNKFGQLMVKNNLMSHPPNELLLLGAINPEELHKIQPTVVEGSVKVLVLSFPTAPERVRFTEDPTPYLKKIRALTTFGEDTFPWSSTNYAEQIVGRGKVLKDTFEVTLLGPPEKIAVDEIELREIEKELSQIMR